MPTPALTFEAPTPHRPVRLGNLFASLRGVSAAHDARRRFQELSERDVHDAGLSPDEVLGESSHQPALPFFMQPGFGTHRR